MFNNLNITFMKKITLLLLGIFPLFCFGQKIQNIKTKEVAELPEKVENYCAVVQQSKDGKTDFIIEFDGNDAWKLLDDDEEKTLEFDNIVAVMNFMYKNYWEYIGNINETKDTPPKYFFRKRS